MIGRCETCRFWRHEHDDDPIDPKRPTGVCTKGATSEWELEDKTTLAAAYDHEGYGATLRTMPTFGCVMHEPREVPTP